jgi:hypothetical protein
MLVPDDLRGRGIPNLVGTPPSYVRQLLARGSAEVPVDTLPESVDGVMVLYDGETGTVIQPKSERKRRRRRSKT